jgi:hypothetical protein
MVFTKDSFSGYYSHLLTVKGYLLTVGRVIILYRIKTIQNGLTIKLNKPMKKLSFLLLPLFAMLCFGCSKKDDVNANPKAATLLAKTWNLSSLKLKTNVKTYDIPKTDDTDTFSIFTFDGKGNATSSDGSKTTKGTYTLASDNIKLTLTESSGDITIFYINSISDTSLELALIAVDQSKKTLTPEEEVSSFLTAIMAIVANIDLNTAKPTSVQPVLVFTGK